MLVHIGLHLKNQRQGVSLLFKLHNVVDLKNGFSALRLIIVYRGNVFQSLQKSFKAMENELYQQHLLFKAIAAGFQSVKDFLIIQKFVLSG